MKRKTIIRTIIFSGIILLGFILYFKPFSPTEIIVLDHMTEMHGDGVESQICLVKNPPWFSSTLEEQIAEFDKTHPVKGNYYQRLFIKPHDNDRFPGLMPFSDETDYESSKTTRNDLDNIDFLADSRYVLTAHGDIIKEIDLRTGDLWYYKY